MRVKIRPSGSLRLRIGVALLAGVSAFATFVIWYSTQTLAATYAEAGRSDTLAIARTFSADVSSNLLDDRQALQARLERLRELNPHVVEVSLYRREAGRNTRVASTDRSELYEPVKAHDVVPLRTGQYEYEEEREDGEHLAEVNYPLVENGRPFAVLGLYIDLEPLDLALAQRKQDLAMAAGATALLVTLLLSLVFGRSVFRPLHRLRLATHQIAEGELETRLGWERRDEIGALARDFDLMAEELERKHDRLENLALIDALTGLANHRAVQERFAGELDRARREGYPVAVVALDIDRFKDVNDRLGHGAGDEALRLTAHAMRAAVRPSDICGRVGGDEFLLVLPRTTAAKAEEVAARVRHAVATIPFGEVGWQITLSAGIAEFPRDAADQAELMRLADGALYQAKREGRDRSFVYSSETGHALSAEEEATNAQHSAMLNTLHALARAVDAKDAYTALHSTRVAHYAATLAAALGLDPDRVRLVRIAGVLHDVGKIGISDAILLKRGPLTKEEYREIQRHSELGREILAGAGMMEIAAWVCHLHERPDGEGYPNGLTGAEIPFEARILAAADALEAMTSSRSYRLALSVEEALEELRRHADTQFDPIVVARLVDLVESGELRIGEEAREAREELDVVTA